jgi:putative transposase
MVAHKIKKFRHADYLLHVHLVFVTKYRREIFGAPLDVIIKQYIQNQQG